ncbi:MAG: class II aldolase/adducin family protein [Fimbriimonadaceae bacterium]|nr:class II aldolase/adducin family protein [Fimbriimonadaceae bacterium]
MGQLTIREQVCLANQSLRSEGLVTMHSGNVSGLDGEILYIKPSGMDYGAMTPESMVPVDIHSGEVLETIYRPSVDLPHHLFLYRRDPSIQSVVHTHSNYATAFAAVHRPIPLVLTAIADEFGGEIPCTPYIDNEGENIGKAILEYRRQAPAILLGSHGVFAWGPSVQAALKAAVMVEDVAKTVHVALQLGTPPPLDPEEALKWWERYHNRYGQNL